MHVTAVDRRRMLATSAGLLGGMSLSSFLGLRAQAADPLSPAPAKRCIILYCWGGMSHHETWDPKPQAPVEIRGEFQPIQTVTPGIEIGEHMPKLARHTDKLAILRSMHHNDSAHGRGMYWNLTGHQPPRVGNIAPERADWPTLAAMIAKFRNAPLGVPPAVRLPYPMVDNNTLQAGEYGGWLGARYDPIVMRPESGDPWGGVSRSLGSEVLELKSVDQDRVAARARLLSSLETTISPRVDFESFDHFRNLAREILLGSAVRDAYDLEQEDARTRESYGSHLCGKSVLLARRLTEAGVSVVR